MLQSLKAHRKQNIARVHLKKKQICMRDVEWWNYTASDGLLIAIMSFRSGYFGWFASGFSTGWGPDTDFKSDSDTVFVRSGRGFLSYLDPVNINHDPKLYAMIIN